MIEHQDEPSTEDIKRRDGRLRQKADRNGFRVSKARRDYSTVFPGRYMLIDAYTNGVVDYGMDLEQAEDALTRKIASEKKRMAGIN